LVARTSRRLGVDEQELATRVAWLYYESSLTQVEIAARLGMPQTRVQRLIARAIETGIVRISICGSLASCAALEAEMRQRYGLKFCRIVPSPPEGASIFSALGRAGADYLTDRFEQDQQQIVGMGHGRTIAASIDHMRPGAYPALTVVSALGDVPRRVGASPFDVIHALADKTNATAYLAPVPFYANSPEDRVMLFRQRGVAEAFRLAAKANFFAVGIGEVKASAFLGRSGMVLADEFAIAQADGAAAELLGTFYDAAGHRVETELHDRVMALDPEVMRGRDVLAIAGGVEKRGAIDAALRTGLISDFITDELTAQHLTRPPASRLAAAPEKATTKSKRRKHDEKT
jgi:DNA-binding transcriptional regulator LsrR (DeoR family)